MFSFLKIRNISLVIKEMDHIDMYITDQCLLLVLNCYKDKILSNYS